MRSFKIVLCITLFATMLSAMPLFAQATGKVLLAYEKTSFKNKLIVEMERLLTSAGFSVVKAEHPKGGLNAYKASDYAVVFITNSGVNSKVRPWVTEWIEKNGSSGTYILLHTTQIKDWKVVTSVDAVTSASAKNEINALASQYVSRITDAVRASSTPR